MDRNGLKSPRRSPRVTAGMFSLPEHIIDVRCRPGERVVICGEMVATLVKSHQQYPRATHIFQAINGKYRVFRVPEA